MIKKIFRSELDLDNLSLKRSIPVEQVGKNLDYKKKVVSKPWGYEYLMFENEYVAIWILFLKQLVWFIWRKRVPKSIVPWEEPISICCAPRKTYLYPLALSVYGNIIFYWMLI